MEKKESSPLFKRIENEIQSYLTRDVELSEGVFFSQHKTVSRIYKFKNRNLSGSKINADLSYDYYFDIISPRADSEVKNLRFDTKNIVAFSQNPNKDFPAVFIANASLKGWMAEHGEDDKLKAAVEEFTANGNIGFKKVTGGYEITDPLNTYITNIRAEHIDDTDIIERHQMVASQLMRMKDWDKDSITSTIKECGNKSFSATRDTTATDSTSKHFEVYEFTGEVNEKEFNLLKKGLPEGDENVFFLAKVIVSGLNTSGTGEKYVLFAEKLDDKDKLSDHYIYAHRGRYEGRFWRVGMYELLFDHQIRANEIGNQLARGLEWASKVIFRSKDSKVLQNIRADLDNGDVVITDDLAQVDVRMRGMDQLIADWNRLGNDADRLSNSTEIVRGETPAGTPFRMGLLMDQNAGKLFTILRQKITLPYKRVFREWVLPELFKFLKGEDVFRLIGDTDILDQLREIMVESWYAQNLIAIGPHTKEIADTIKAEKLDQLRKVDPVIKNTQDVWKGVLPRIFITITGENSDIADQITDMMTMIKFETDPVRVAWILDTIYKARGIPIPPKKEEAPPEMQQPDPSMMNKDKTQQSGGMPANEQPQGAREAAQPMMQ
jgi:hypothetical protein